MRFLFVLLLFGITAADRYEPLPDEALSTGEIDILTWNETSAAGMQATALRAADKKWPNAKVPLKFDNSISADERKIIAQGIEEIHNKTCVRFTNTLESNQDYVLVVKQLNRICSSFVGRQGGKQQLSLGQGCYHRGIILHELMHAIGFVHEHNRPDRDEYVTINWDMIKEKEKHNFEKRNASDLTLVYTPYTYDSIMHYSENLLSKDGWPTIVSKKEGVKLGGADRLSPTDILRINRYYDCKTVSDKKECDCACPTTLRPTEPVGHKHNNRTTTDLPMEEQSDEYYNKIRQHEIDKFKESRRLKTEMSPRHYWKYHAALQMATIPEFWKTRQNTLDKWIRCLKYEICGTEWTDGGIRYKCSDDCYFNTVGCINRDGSLVTNYNWEVSKIEKLKQSIQLKSNFVCERISYNFFPHGSQLKIWKSSS